MTVLLFGGVVRKYVGVCSRGIESCGVLHACPCALRTFAYTGGMRRSLVIMLMAVSAFWQVLAVGGQPGGALGDSRESVHAMLHWQGLTHHHHDDGSVTQDSSEESVQHIALDGMLAVNAAWSAASASWPSAASTCPAAVDEIRGPWPYLDGPRRPPKWTA